MLLFLPEYAGARRIRWVRSTGTACTSCNSTNIPRNWSRGQMIDIQVNPSILAPRLHPRAPAAPEPNEGHEAKKRACGALADQDSVQNLSDASCPPSGKFGLALRVHADALRGNDTNYCDFNYC